MKYISHCDKLEMPKVIAGCMRVKDSGISPSGFMDFVEGCIDMGVCAFDHAPVYGGYTCEEFFGENILGKNPALRGKMKLVTKTGIMLPGLEDNKNICYNSSSRYILAEFERSLVRLRTDYIDLLLIHRPDPMAHPADTASALEKLVKDGKVLNLGVSNYTPLQVEALQKYLSVPLITNQTELSAKNTKNFFNGALDDAYIRNMSLMAWSPLGGGSVFTGGDESSVRLRECLAELSEKYGKDMDTLMYAWLFTHPADIMAVTGTMKLPRVKAAVDALDVRLSQDDWYAVLQASRGYPVP